MNLADLIQKNDEIKTVIGLRKMENHYYDYKLHSKMDIVHQLIREIETTPSSVHDSQVNLTKTWRKI